MLRLTLNDGTVLEVDAGQPWTMREQIEWEKQFHRSFATVWQALAAEERAAAEQPDIPAAHYRVEWMLWFAWRRSRPKVTDRFDTFIDSQLADYDFFAPAPAAKPDEPVEEPAPDLSIPAEDVGLDPTVPALSLTP